MIDHTPLSLYNYDKGVVHMEIWKDIKGYEGLYKISNYGNVFSVRSNRLIIGALNGWGYRHMILINKDGKRKTMRVHRMVAEHFLPNPDNLPQVNHKDTDKTNNHIDNLEWMTQLENTRHAYRNGLIPNNMRAVEMINKDGEIVRTFDSMYEAEREIGASAGNIYKVCTGERQTHMKHKWRFKGGD